MGRRRWRRHEVQDALAAVALDDAAVLADMDEEDPLRATYIKIVVRCSFGIINAGRNSA